MGTASLKYDEHGQVAWNEIWTSFCHLALAGGPPHRGTLLRPVPPDEIAAQPDAYKKVVAELDRGIRLTTWLATARSATPGWVGIRCYDEDMSGWLERAIVAENVSARRERNVLYLPAGPGLPHREGDQERHHLRRQDVPLSARSRLRRSAGPRDSAGR